MRGLTAGALLALLACAPETLDGAPVSATNKPAPAAGSGGRAGAGSAAAGSAAAGSGGAGSTAPARVSSSAGGAGSSSSQPLTVVNTPAGAPAPVVTGPTTALVRIDTFARPDVSTGAAGAPPAPSTGSGVAGNVSRPTLNRTETVPPEVCERLAQANRSPGRRPNDDPRILAILAACEAMRQPTAGAAANSGSAGNTGDVPVAPGAARLVGTAVFTREAEGVQLLVVLDGCKDAAMYPVRIHEGRSCADAMAIGARWDRPRGEDIPDLRCSGSHGSQEYTRFDREDKPWSLGGSSASDLIGHALVINDPEDRTLPIACGVIAAP